ncbi:MAG: hypothetical protein IJH50_01465 [Kiritimatiellae bacterium]|nr:hypothetical protein [Kiritimatiellia bacterium]
MNIKSILIATSLMALGASAADVSYPYTPGNTNPGAGVTIAFDGDNNITSISATPTDGGSITLTGGAPTFAAGATITVNAPGSLVFTGPATANGALAINRGDDAYLAWSSDTALNGTLTESPCFTGLSSTDRDEGRIEFFRLVSTGPTDDNNVFGQQGHWNLITYTGSGIFQFNKVSAAYAFTARVQLGPKTSGENNLYARCLNAIRSPRFGLYPDEEAGWATLNMYNAWSGKAHHTERGRYNITDSYGTGLGSTENLGFRKIIIRRTTVPNGPVSVRFNGGATLGSETTIGAGLEAVFVATATDAVSLGSAISGDGDLRIETASSDATTTLDCDMSGLVGGKFTIEGKDNAIHTVMRTADTKFPSGGEVHINTNAILTLYGNTVSTSYAWKQSLFVHRGGTLKTIDKTWQIRPKQQIMLDGGTFNVRNGVFYLNYLVLSNATMNGTSSPRSVYNESSGQYWRVIGTEPSYLTSTYGVNVYGASSKSSAVPFRLDVGDVADGVDCFMSRITCDTGGTNVPWFWFEKYGAGTLKISENSKGVRMESRIYNGTLLLAGNSIMTNEVQLLGGNFAIDAGKSNALGNLTATTNATLTVGAGGSLSFASFTPGAGLAEKSIVIDAPMEGNLVRIGTNGNGLAAEHCKYFRWKDATDATKLWRVEQDADGYLHPSIKGVVILVY